MTEPQENKPIIPGKVDEEATPRVAEEQPVVEKSPGEMKGETTSEKPEEVPVEKEPEAPVDKEADKPVEMKDESSVEKEEKPAETAEEVSMKKDETTAETKTTTEAVDEGQAAEKKHEEVDNKSEEKNDSTVKMDTTETPEKAVEVQAPPPPVETKSKEVEPPKQALPTRQYLDSTVVPILHSALSQLAKVRPDDPIKFLGEYLLEYKDKYCN